MTTALRSRRRVGRARYLAALDRADRDGSDVPEARVQRIGETIERLRRQMAFLRRMQTQVEASDERQVSLTDPDAMAVRRQTVEHVFGTPKAWMGSTPFPTKGLRNVRTEMRLAVLAYNMKRMIRLFGTGEIIQAIRT